jgi:hypothetical protein
VGPDGQRQFGNGEVDGDRPGGQQITYGKPARAVGAGVRCQRRTGVMSKARRER